MTKHIMTSVAFAGVLLSSGCATKKYVAKTVDPVRDKVDTVATQSDKQGQTIAQQGTEIGQHGDQLKKQGADIEQAQTNIAANKERAMAADNRATEALKKSDDALSRTAELRQVVANLDDYKPAGNAVIPFGFNKDSLTADAKAELDKLITDKPTSKRYFISVEGFTDTVGSSSYNNQLSRRRAEAVTQYLVAKHDVPVYRIHMIGLGEEKPADEGKNRAARAKNRRVEVTFYTAESVTTAAAGSN